VTLQAVLYISHHLIHLAEGIHGIHRLAVKIDRVPVAVSEFVKFLQRRLDRLVARRPGLFTRREIR
jgi:hypothetical protein